MVILVLTGLPGSLFSPPKNPWGQDKIVHAIMYMGFAFLSLWGYRKSYLEQGKAYRRKALLVVLAISIAYGALTEIMQEQLIPKRTGSVYDWIADLVGSLLGTLLFYFLYRKGNNLPNRSFYK